MQEPTSSKPRKQRKWLYTKPLHKRQKSMACMLSKPLKEKFQKNAISVRKGDEVTVLRGAFKGTKGEVLRVDLGKYKVFVGGVIQTKVDGTQVERPIHPSNLMITELNLDDKKRRETLERKESGVSE